MFQAPLARYRLYGHTSDYATLAARLFEREPEEGGAVRALEAAAEAIFGVAHAIAVPQNRVGTYLALRALVPAGKKVILSPYTLSDVINMVIAAGLVPVFADIRRDTCNLDPDAVEPLIDGETGAVLATHLHGLASDIEELRAICRRHGLRLIEDAAQSCGARVGGRRAGTFGDAGVFSFGMYKNVNSFFGGLVVTDDAEAAAKIRAELAGFAPMSATKVLSKGVKAAMTDLATHPLVFRAFTYWVFRHAYLNDIEALNRSVKIELDPKLRETFPESYGRRLRPVQARIARRQLREIDRLAERRIALAEIYHRGLGELNSVLTPPLHRDGRHIYLHYPIQVPDREALIRELVRGGCDIAIQHLRNCAELPCFAAWRRDCPNARQTAGEMILLPTYPGFTVEHAERVVEGVRRHMAGR